MCSKMPHALVWGHGRSARFSEIHTMHCRMLTESLTSEKTTKVIQSNPQHIPTMPTNQNPIEAAMSPCILEQVHGVFFASSLCTRPLLCYLTCRVWPFLFLPELHSHALGWKYLCNVSFGKYTLGRACFSVHNDNLVHRHVGWPRVSQVGATALPNIDLVLFLPALLISPTSSL